MDPNFLTDVRIKIELLRGSSTSCQVSLREGSRVLWNAIAGNPVQARRDAEEQASRRGWRIIN